MEEDQIEEERFIYILSEIKRQTIEDYIKSQEKHNHKK